MQFPPSREKSGNRTGRHRGLCREDIAAFSRMEKPQLQESLFGLVCPELTNFHQLGDSLFLGTFVNNSITAL